MGNEEFQSAIIPPRSPSLFPVRSRRCHCRRVPPLCARDRSSSLATSPVGPHAGYKWRHYSLIIRDTERGVSIVRCGRRARNAPAGQHLPDRFPFFFPFSSRTRQSIGAYLLAPWQRASRTSSALPPAGKDERFMPRCTESAAIPSYNRFRAR